MASQEADDGSSQEDEGRHEQHCTQTSGSRDTPKTQSSHWRTGITHATPICPLILVWFLRMYVLHCALLYARQSVQWIVNTRYSMPPQSIVSLNFAWYSVYESIKRTGPGVGGQRYTSIP